MNRSEALEIVMEAARLRADGRRYERGEAGEINEALEVLSREYASKMERPEGVPEFLYLPDTYPSRPVKQMYAGEKFYRYFFDCVLPTSDEKGGKT